MTETLSSTPKAKAKNGKKLATTQSVDQAVWSVCDIMRRSNCAGALQYVPELTWILFLRILDEMEQREAEEAAIVKADHRPSIAAPYRWHDWAAPHDEDKKVGEREQGWKRKHLTDGAMGQFFEFVNEKLIPYLQGLRDHPNATARQKIIGEVMAGVERTRIDTEKNLLDVLDKVHEISNADTDPTHVFLLSQVYEGLLLRMGEKGNDGGQFFTPREIIRAVVRVVSPKAGETVYDPCCGTGGFLAESYRLIASTLGKDITGDQIEALKRRTFFGREKENLIFPIALANLMLHGIDEPHLWHGNTLTGHEVYGGLFHGSPALFDVVLTNPPFGGKEGKDAQTNFAYKTSATQVLFLQHVMNHLKPGGRCGIVLDEGVLFRTNETAFVQTKRKLVDEFDLYCIVSLPGGVFSATGAGVKTNLLFFNRTGKTDKIWYYDLSDIKVGKRTPFTLDKFDDFLKLLPTRADSERSWTIDLTARRTKAQQDAAPYRQKAQSKQQEAAAHKDAIKQLKKSNPDDTAAIEAADAAMRVAEKESREAAARAQAIEDAAFDLKAVNPNAKADQDTRTPEQLLDLIEAKGKEIADALAVLRGLTKANG